MRDVGRADTLRLTPRTIPSTIRASWRTKRARLTFRKSLTGKDLASAGPIVKWNPLCDAKWARRRSRAALSVKNNHGFEGRIMRIVSLSDNLVYSLKYRFALRPAGHMMILFVNAVHSARGLHMTTHSLPTGDFLVVAVSGDVQMIVAEFNDVNDAENYASAQHCYGVEFHVIARPYSDDFDNGCE